MGGRERQVEAEVKVEPRRRAIANGRGERIAAGLVGLAALMLYARTLAPGVVSIADDSLEFQMVALRGAIPHPTGYPLYALLLSLATRLLPVGEVAFRANLLSALAASLAVALTYLVARTMRLSGLAALTTATLLALSPTFWAQATLAEVYPLHLTLVAALLLSVLRWEKQHRDSPTPVLPFWAAFWAGLGLTHHRMSALWLPAILLYVILVGRRAGWRWRSLPLRGWAALLGAGLAPLLLYAWLPLRASVGSIDGTYQEVGVSCWVRACQYIGFFQDNTLASARPLSFFAALTVAEIGLWGVALAAAGVVSLVRGRMGVGLLLGVGTLTNALFALLYRVPDPEVFWLPTSFGLALLAGWGAQWLIQGFISLTRRRGHPPLAMAAPLIALLLFPPLFVTALRFQAMDRSAVTEPPTFNGRDLLAQPLPDNAVIIGLLGEITYLRYLQEAQALRPELPTLALPTDPASLRVAAVEEALAAGQRPFLTTELPGAGERWSLSALGPLVEVRATPQRTVPDALWPLELALTDAVTLAAWSRSPVVGRDAERLTLAWRVVAPIDEPLQVSVRLVAADGALLCEAARCQRDVPPLRNAYPTTLWRPGEIILDTYDLPPAPPDAHYLVILYRPADGSEVGRAMWAR